MTQHAAVESALDALFDAARYATMAFLSTDNTKWGELSRQLPRAFSERLRKFIGAFHVQYHYDGLYPKDTADEEFARWREAVSQFVDDLENAAPEGNEDTPNSLSQ